MHVRRDIVANEDNDNDDDDFISNDNEALSCSRINKILPTFSSGCNVIAE